MEKKDKEKRQGLTAGDILIAVLIALAGSIAFMTIALVVGSIMFPESWERKTADHPPAVSQTTRGTLPSSAPTPSPTPEPAEPPVEPSDEPSNEPIPEPTQQAATPTAVPSQAPAPVQTQTPAPAQTRAPAAPVPTRTPVATPSMAPAQNPGPVVSINPTTPPTQQTATPTQSGNNTQINGRTVYVTQTGSHWHYDNNCNGGRYYIPQQGEIERRGLTPCNRCVLN